MKIIYLASHKAKLNIRHEVIYQDKFIQRDLAGDMLDVDLSKYDLIIATPPCNYYSRANYRRDQSKYALETKHLLPMILNKLQRQNKPYIVENVRNPKLMEEIIKTFNGFIYIHGRHTYFTNYMFVCSDIPQVMEYKTTKTIIKNGKKMRSGQIALFNKKEHEGGSNVNRVLERFIETYEASN
jgi:site-specific DNA-cytosine methylase